MGIVLHRHILSENWADLEQPYGYCSHIRREPHQPCRARMMIGDSFLPEIEDSCRSPERCIEGCDNAGVDAQRADPIPHL